MLQHTLRGLPTNGRSERGAEFAAQFLIQQMYCFSAVQSDTGRHLFQWNKSEAVCFCGALLGVQWLYGIYVPVHIYKIHRTCGR